MSDVALRLDDGDELVTRAEIAQRLRRTPRTVEQWWVRYNDAPEAVNEGGFLLYRWSKVTEWAGEAPEGDGAEVGE